MTQNQGYEASFLSALALSLVIALASATGNTCRGWRCSRYVKMKL